MVYPSQKNVLKVLSIVSAVCLLTYSAARMLGIGPLTVQLNYGRTIEIIGAIGFAGCMTFGAAALFVYFKMSGR